MEGLDPKPKLEDVSNSTPAKPIWENSKILLINNMCDDSKRQHTYR